MPRRDLAEVHLRALRLLVAEPADPRQRGRRIPAEVRRAVWTRDGGRCTYVAPDGRRCSETSLLELHHRAAFALGGRSTVDNVTLRCRAHNLLAAEQDFGRDRIANEIERARGRPTS